MTNIPTSEQENKPVCTFTTSECSISVIYDKYTHNKRRYIKNSPTLVKKRGRK